MVDCCRVISYYVVVMVMMDCEDCHGKLCDGWTIKLWVPGIPGDYVQIHI